MNPYFMLIRRDIALAWHGGAAGWNALGFFLLAVAMFPLSLGPEPLLLARIGGGVVWVAALFAAFLSLDQIFARDHEDGSLDLLLAEPLSPALIALSKSAAHWLATAGPLLIAAPLMALSLHLSFAEALRLALALALGTPALSLLGGVGAALTLGVRETGVLLAILVLPLYVPVLIFGAGAVTPVMGNDPANALALLAAFSLIMLVAAPLAMAAALKIALE